MTVVLKSVSIKVMQAKAAAFIMWTRNVNTL